MKCIFGEKSDLQWGFSAVHHFRKIGTTIFQLNILRFQTKGCTGNAFPAFFRLALQPDGCQRIAVGADLKDGYVATHGWLETSNVAGVDFCKELRDMGVATVIYTDISRDGAEKGTNLELYRQLSKIEGLNITASGGVSSIEELKKLAENGAKITPLFFLNQIYRLVI